MDETAASQDFREPRPLINPSYIRDTWIGRLKIGEFFCALLAGALVPVTVYKHAAAFSFMSFVTWTTFICIFIDLILHLAYVWEKLTFLTEHPEVLLSLCVFGAFLFGIAAVREIAVATHP